MNFAKHPLTSVNISEMPMDKGIEGEEVFAKHLLTPPSIFKF